MAVGERDDREHEWPEPPLPIPRAATRPAVEAPSGGAVSQGQERETVAALREVQSLLQQVVRMMERTAQTEERMLQAIERMAEQDTQATWGA